MIEQPIQPRVGIQIGIVRDPEFDYSFGGISAGRSRLTLVGRGVPEYFAETPEAPAVYLTRDEIGRPIVCPELDASGYENGGAYAILGDNIADLVPFYGAVPIHDRKR
ncbi:hypothetical protein GCM10025867_48510 (plasmid) [Frondihabitans sucicola]|uniref:Uncharacterized protein n=1 Tax=Frondihabitans sucicola TaxID=1268041 RepID=A0ABM8GVY2_9MICO|nr:hypothetical protein [Frondihabitans sucicola]BDZ52610.1 hypothetical protein GCM10025867_48510 [Frondihabitans sucicola]